jgi:hypothetical protein
MWQYITYNGVPLRVDLDKDEEVLRVLAGGVDILPLLEDDVIGFMADMALKQFDEFRSE